MPGIITEQNNKYKVKLIKVLEGFKEKEGRAKLLPEGTNIDDIREEGIFFIKNPTGTRPMEEMPGGNITTVWCILEQEKVHDVSGTMTYWFVQTAKFSRLNTSPITLIELWHTYQRQITDNIYSYTQWVRVDNIPVEKVFSVTGESYIDRTVDMTELSNEMYISVINCGYGNNADFRTIKTLTINNRINGLCRIYFKTDNFSQGNTFSLVVNSNNIFNKSYLENYVFESNSVYELSFRLFYEYGTYIAEIKKI